MDISVNDNIKQTSKLGLQNYLTIIKYEFPHCFSYTIIWNKIIFTA